MATDRPANEDIEQALIITIPLSDKTHGSKEEREQLSKLEDDLIKAIEHSGVGEYDGNEFGGGTFTMYAYGSSADRLLDAALPVLTGYDLPKGSSALKRYGKPGAKAETISIGKGAVN